jgi:hypothetical protein
VTDGHENRAGFDAPPGASDLEGDARPALTPAQLAFLALIAALIITALRRLRRKGA